MLALSGGDAGLFRNPLADPGLVGVSSGAALGAALAIVFGALAGWLAGVPSALPAVAVRLGGGLGVTWLVYRLGRRDGQTSVATMLLAGIALTALSGAVIGLFTYLADDATLRTLTFWNLGSLNGASYPRLWPLLLVALLVACWLPRRADALNALLLGESEARHLGFDVERLKAELVLCTALSVGAAVAAAGMIGFIGLVVPHLIRLVAGPDHRTLLPASAMAGAILLLLADLLARLALAPAELPIGIVTALIGAPFFLYLLLRGGPDAARGEPVHPPWRKDCTGRPRTGAAAWRDARRTRPQRRWQEHLAWRSLWRTAAGRRAGAARRARPRRLAGRRSRAAPGGAAAEFVAGLRLSGGGGGRLRSAAPFQRPRARCADRRRGLAAADASHLAGRSYLALSGGERQRVHLARVLAQLWPGEPGQVLLLDEPTSALDPLHQHTTLQAVHDFARRGASVLVILHDLNLAARYCDRLLLLQNGRPHLLGTPEEVLRPEPLRAVFGLEVLVQRHPERGHPLIVAR